MKKSASWPLLILLVLLLAGLAGCSGKKGTPLDPRYKDAVEIRLKCRELADQMLATMPNYALEGYVAMPTSFVDQNNTSRSSQLGRLVAETLFYEFNQRGFPTREYRLTGNISVRGARDNLVMVPNADICSTQKWSTLLLGTYLVDEDATFINARLVRAKDGLVLRTGQLVLVNTDIIRRLATPDKVSAAPVVKNAASKGKAQYQYNGLYSPIQSLGTGTIPIRQSR